MGNSPDLVAVIHSGPSRRLLVYNDFCPDDMDLLGGQERYLGTNYRSIGVFPPIYEENPQFREWKTSICMVSMSFRHLLADRLRD